MSPLSLMGSGAVLHRALRSPDGQLALLWALLGAPWLLGIKAIPYDATQQFFPALGFVAEQLRALQAPWWNPYLFGGYPQVADPQMMGFQPSMVLPMLLAPTSLHWFSALTLLHVLGGGLGSLRLARHYRLEPPAQLVFALVMMFGAVAASRLQHTPMIVSFAYLPWFWLALSRLCLQGGWRQAGLAGVLGGLCALQLTQVTYFIILGSAVYATTALFRTPSGGRPRLFLQLASVASIAATVSAPQWLSTLAWLPYTNRTAVGLDAATAGALHLQSLSTLLSGNVFEQGRGTAWGSGDISQDYLYIGAVPLALWLCWGSAVVKAEPVRARVAMAVVVLALVSALGARTPLFPWLLSWLPGLDLFRRPADALFVALPAAAWLCAHAFQQALARPVLRPHLPSLVGVALLLAYTLWQIFVVPAHPRALVWLTLSAGLGLCGVLAARKAGRGAPRGVALLFGVLVMDLLVFNVGTSFNVGSIDKFDPFTTRSGGTHSAYRALSALRGPGIPERAAVFDLTGMTNGAALRELPLVNGYNPMVASDYHRMTGFTPRPAARPEDLSPTPWADGPDAPLFDLLGQRLRVASHPFPGSTPFETVHIARNDDVLPRLLTPFQTRRHAGHLPDAAHFGNTDFTRTLWLPAGTRPEAVKNCADAREGAVQASVVDYRPSAIRIRYRAATAGWLVVNEVIAPGWQARIDGREVPLFRANGLFRAVCVPPGQGELLLAYSPLTLWKTGLASWRGGHAVQPDGGGPFH